MIINEKTVKVETIEIEKIFINTGSKSNIPNVGGVEKSNIVYNNETLMQLKKLSKKLPIIGAGYIGLEFAKIYAHQTMTEALNDVLSPSMIKEI